MTVLGIMSKPFLGHFPTIPPNLFDGTETENCGLQDKSIRLSNVNFMSQGRLGAFLWIVINLVTTWGPRTTRDHAQVIGTFHPDCQIENNYS